MSTTPKSSKTNKLTDLIRTSITFRLFVVGFLVIILLIPLIFVQNLIEERASRQVEVVAEIQDKWGDAVLLYGPILQVPYKTYSEKAITNTKTKEVTTEIIEKISTAYFFPEVLDIKAAASPQIKKRGIYETAVYTGDIKLAGNFAKPDFSELEIPDEHILWNKARILLKTSNLKGVKNQVIFQYNGESATLTSKYESQHRQLDGTMAMHTLQSAPLKNLLSSEEKTIRFTTNISVNGSADLQFVPIGKTTEARITSNWHTNNFTGNYLPYNDDKLQEKGFDARWKVLDINRPFDQEYFHGLPNLNEEAFGVNFMIPVDEYQKSERTAKYGFLVIGLTFLLFFLIQTLSKIAVHPFQYLMIGLALVMFYTLLIAISEHSSFLSAYLIAAVSVIVLITLYSKSILKIWKFPVFIGSALTGLYSFIYVIIQLESYALLVGSIGLFAILAAVMYVSRKIDWEGTSNPNLNPQIS
ncbi:MAG: cell envelope integrity protein CreD [Leeuwenhoekiella sp.]